MPTRIHDYDEKLQRYTRIIAGPKTLRLDATQKQLLEVIGNASRLKILFALRKYNKQLRIYKIC